MPVLVHGGDSDEVSLASLRCFALCSLIDRRDASKVQVNVIGTVIFINTMAWGLKASLGLVSVLLCLSIGFAIYALYTESQVLRQIQRELIQLLRDTPTSDLEAYFNDEHSLFHQD